MALKLRGETFWIDVMVAGKRLRESLKTDDKKLAQQLHDMRKAELWKEGVLKEKPKKTFADACAMWLVERAHKKSIRDDKDKIAVLLPKLRDKLLRDISRDVLEALLPKDVSPSTRNRYRALVRSILRACEREWGWLDRAPVFRTEQEPRGRVMFLSRQQAEVLIAALPETYRMPVRFALLTGLRKSNVFNLQWSHVDLAQSTAVVEADEAKAGHRITVPLNKAAVALLASLAGPREGYVWGKRNLWGNTWTAAVRRAGVPAAFRFHDLRHTWASWHAMAGTPLSVLQELGGWHSPQMVLKYAHMSPQHLADAAERVTL